MKQKKTYWTLKIKPETHFRIRQIAEAEERTVIGVVERIINRYEQKERRCKNGKEEEEDC